MKVNSLFDIQKHLSQIFFFDRLAGNAISLRFDENISAKYGVKFCQKINTPKGLAFVLGQNKSDMDSNNLWVMIENDHGISYWTFDKKINETVDFSLIEQEPSINEILFNIDKISNYRLFRLPINVLNYPLSQSELKNDLARITFAGRANKTYNFIYNESILQKNNVRLGQEIITPKGSAVIISMEEKSGHNILHVIMKGENAVSSWTGPFTENRGFFLQNDILLNKLLHTIYLTSDYSEVITQRVTAKAKFSSELKNDNQLRNDSVLLFQRNYRRRIVQNKFAIKSLKKDQLTSEQTFIIGNDPTIPSELDQYKVYDQKIALIATSGMRAVELAVRLGNIDHIPKIFIVDNSKKVYQFWYALREFTRDDQCALVENFLKNLSKFLNKHIDLYTDTSISDIQKYLENLIQKYGYDFIRKVILNASLYKQSWTDEDTFHKIKNILRYLSIDKVFMYPSNIIACINSQEERSKLLSNIEIIDPILAIHTDLVINRPENVYFFKKEKQQEVLKHLVPKRDASIHQQMSVPASLDDDLTDLSPLELMEKMVNMNDYDEIIEKIKNLSNFEEAMKEIVKMIEEVEKYKQLGNSNN